MDGVSGLEFVQPHMVCEVIFMLDLVVLEMGGCTLSLGLIWGLLMLLYCLVLALHVLCLLSLVWEDSVVGDTITELPLSIIRLRANGGTTVLSRVEEAETCTIN